MADWGHITVGKPKIWQYERVYALLDGMLRDVEGIQLAELKDLDPNKANAALYRTLQTAFEVGAQYDQQSHFQNRLEGQKIEAVRTRELENLQLHYDFVRELMLQRQAVLAERSRVRTQLSEKESQLAQLPENDPKRAKLQEEIDILKKRGEGLDEQRTQLTDQINATPPGVTGSSPSYPSGTTGDNAFSHLNPGEQGMSFLAGLFDGLDADHKEKILSQLADPSYPVTKQIENFHTLLWERLARQLTVFQHEEIRDTTRKTYLLEFDVGISPSKKAEEHLARVEFSCDGCIAYSLYPGQSSYNISNFYGKSSRTGIAGMVTTLFGFGLRAEYRRQKDELRSSLIQSVYTAGFGEGTGQFGWDFGAPPFEETLRRGMRRTFALVTVDCNVKELNLGWSAGWSRRQDPMHRNGSGDPWTLRSGSWPVPLEGDGDACLKDDGPAVRSLVYNTVYVDLSRDNRGGGAAEGLNQPNSGAGLSGNEPEPEQAQVILRLNQPVDPNLVVTVRGKPLTRLRDWRGQATPGHLSAIETDGGQLGTEQRRRQLQRGLLESGDEAAEDVWMTLSSSAILLRIKEKTAGRATFPTIQLQQPSGVLTVPGNLVPESEVVHHHRQGSTTLQRPLSADVDLLEPLFVGLGPPADLVAHQTAVGGEIEIEFADHSRNWESVPSRVILQDRVKSASGLRWKLNCHLESHSASRLLCVLPLPKLAADYQRLLRYESKYETLLKRIDPTSGSSEIRPRREGQSPNLATVKELNQLAYSQFLEVVVEDDSIHSRYPAPLGAVPINQTAGRSYKPWQFKRATNTFVEVEGCGYFTDDKGGEIVTIVGDPNPATFCAEQHDSCICFQLPTAFLARDTVDFEINTLQCLYPDEACPPNRLPMHEFRAQVGEPRIETERGSGGRVDAWVVSFDAERLSGEERLEPDFAKICQPGQDCACPMDEPGCITMQHARLAGSRQRLTLRIPSFGIDGLPPSDRRVHLVRGSNRIGTLPDLRASIFPGPLTLNRNGRELILQGDRADLIREILLYGSAAEPIRLTTRSTRGRTLATLPEKLDPDSYVVRIVVGFSQLDAVDPSGNGIVLKFDS